MRYINLRLTLTLTLTYQSPAYALLCILIFFRFCIIPTIVMQMCMTFVH